jgi:hypothetical protein
VILRKNGSGLLLRMNTPQLPEPATNTPRWAAGKPAEHSTSGFFSGCFPYLNHILPNPLEDIVYFSKIDDKKMAAGCQVQFTGIMDVSKGKPVFTFESSALL